MGYPSQPVLDLDLDSPDLHPHLQAIATCCISYNHWNSSLKSEMQRARFSHSKLARVVPPPASQSTSALPPLLPLQPLQVSTALTLTGKQLDIMYAVSGCADVKGLVRNVTPEVRCI